MAFYKISTMGLNDFILTWKKFPGGDSTLNKIYKMGEMTELKSCIAQE
jgi:hypothetical protein